MTESNQPENCHIHVENGNYNECIEGNYIEGNYFQVSLDFRHQNKNYPKYRQKLLTNVDKNIQSVINTSLYNKVYVLLEMEQNPEQIKYPLEVKVNFQRKVHFKNEEIINIFEMTEVSGRLLILGQPGAGKTTTLYKLAEELINRAKHDSAHPIPVVFSLSSWKNDNQNIKDWLVEQLKEKYGVQKDIGKQLVDSQEIIPLLDGLDEVAVERQEKCVIKINEFLEPSNWTNPVVVCSRIQEYCRYEALLDLNNSIELHPFSQEQVYQYLKITDNLQLWNSISCNEDLKQLATTPLLLNIIILSAQKISISKWQQLKSSEERLRYLFDAYIKEMLNIKTSYKGKQYNHKNTLKWLGWLAYQLTKENATEFLIEGMQPIYLKNKIQKIVYSSIMWGLILGLIFGLIVGFIFYVLFLLSHDKFMILLILIPGGLIFGLIYGLIHGVIGEQIKNQIAKKIRSNNRFQKISIQMLIFGPIFGIISGVIFVLIYELFIYNIGQLTSGVISGVIYLLVGELIENQLKPNNHLKNANQIRIKLLIFGLIYGILSGIISGYFTVNPYFNSYAIVIFYFPFSDILSSLITINSNFNVGMNGAIYGVIYGLIGELIENQIKLNNTLNKHSKISIKLFIYMLIFGVLSWSIKGVIFGLTVGTNGGQAYSLMNVVIFGTLYGIIAGVFFGPIYILVGDKIQAVENIQFSLKKSLHGVILGLILGLTWMRTMAFLGLEVPLFSIINFIFIIITGLSLGLILGISSTEVQNKMIPNQGIRQSTINTIILSTGSCLFTTLLIFVIKQFIQRSINLNQALISSLVPALFLGLLTGITRSGTPAIKHFILRIILWSSGYIPWNYAKFLDYSTNRLFLQRVGGGYRFMHDLLRQHFANSYAQKNLTLIQETPSENSLLVPNYILCSSCGHNNLANSNFCIKCGRRLK